MAAHRKAALKLSIPDMEETKNKKIVQLTKVIYHLNTKQEDHQREIKNLAKTYEAEIQQILTDSYTKIEEVRKSSKQWERRATDNVLYKELQLQYDRDKSLAQQQLQRIKGLHKQQLDEMRQSYREQVETLQSDCQSTKQQMIHRVTAFKQLVDAMKQNHLSTTTQLKAKFDHDLLALTTKHEDIMTSKNDTFDRLKKGLLTRHEKETAKLNVQHKLKSQQMQSTHSQEIESLQRKQHNAILELNTAIDSLKKEKQELSAQLRSSQTMIITMENSMTKHEERERSLSAQIATFKSNIVTLQSKVKTVEQSKQRSEKRANDLSLALQSKNKEISSLQYKHNQISKMMEGKDSQFVALSNDNRTFKEQLDILQIELQSEQHKLREITAAKLKAATTAEDTQQQLRSSLSDLRQQLNSVTNQWTKAQQELKWSESRHRALEKRLKSLRVGMAKTKGTAKASKLYIDDIKSEWTAFDRHCKSYFAVLQDGVSAKYQNLKRQQSSNLHSLEMEYEAKLHSMKNEKDSADSQWSHQLEQEKDKLMRLHQAHNTLKYEQHQQQLGSVELKAVISEKESMIKQLEREIDDQHQQFTKDIADKEKEIAILGQAIDDRQKQIDDQESAQKNATKYLRKLEQEHHDKVTRLELLNQQTLKEKMRAIEEMENVQQTMGQDQSKWIKQLHDAEQRFEQQLKQCREGGRLEIANLTKEYTDTTRRLEQEHQVAMEQLIQHHQDQIDRESDSRHAKDKRTKQSFQKQLDEMRKSHETQINTLTTTYKEEMERLRKTADEEMESALARQRRDAEATLKELRQEFDHEVSELTQQNEGTMKQMLTRKHEEIRELKGNMEALNKEIVSLKQTIDDQINDIKRQETEFEDEKKELYGYFKKEKKELEGERQQLFTEWKAEKAQQDFNHEEELNQLRVKYDKSIMEMKSKCIHLETEYEKLHKKYQGRPSRKEDVEKIRELNIAIKTQKQRVVTTENRMTQLKKELMNREKNYNSMFGRQPQVGVMNKVGINGKNSKRRK